MKSYDIFVDGVCVSHITTNTLREAKAYFCGMVEAFGFGKRKRVVEAYTKDGKRVY